MKRIERLLGERGESSQVLFPSLKTDSEFCRTSNRFHSPVKVNEGLCSETSNSPLNLLGNELELEGLAFVRSGNPDTLFYIMANSLIGMVEKGYKVLYIQRFDPEAKWTLDLDFLEKLARKRGLFLDGKIEITRDRNKDWIDFDLVVADVPLPEDPDRLHWIECLKRLSWSLPVFIFEQNMGNLGLEAPRIDLVHSNGWVMADFARTGCGMNVRRIPLFRDPFGTVRSWITEWVEFSVAC